MVYKAKLLSEKSRPKMVKHGGWYKVTFSGFRPVRVRSVGLKSDVKREAGHIVYYGFS